MLLQKVCALAMLSSVGLSSACALSSGTAAPGLTPDTQPESVRYLVPEIVDTHPFDENAFTQGLEVDGERLIVGTGWWGNSEIFHLTVNGVKSNAQKLDDQYFGEGITRAGDYIWQLTWQAGVAFKRDAESLEVVDQVSYEGEGWGLCAFDDRLIMSDGTSEVRQVDPVSFEESSRTTITLDGQPVKGINELECVDGKVFANLFLSTDIIQFDPDTGAVTAVIDASNLPNNATPDPNNVLNGIAHLPGTDRFYLTGKRWPDLYEVRLVDAG